ncbi:MAG: sensor histidine kinase, partial [Selenomonadaceae bacterium]|nr:sensor histidine kinase [Selenomonadaceae bacterium]
TPPLYKAILIFGALIWLVVLMLTVRRKILQHIFIYGMTVVWSTIQHNWAAIAVVIIFSADKPLEIILTHAALYVMLFVICLPLERRCFVTLLPPKNFFDYYGKFSALFPLLITLGVVILWAQEPLIHTWQERFSRFYLPFVFFFFYRHIMITTERLNSQSRETQNMRRMKDHLAVLSEYNRLMQENSDTVAVMRNDLRHIYRMIYMMLQSGKVDAVKEFIESQEKLLGKTAVKTFCKLPLVNAALSIYVTRAKTRGIEVNYKINLPMNIRVDEGDLALLISNLMENAINASRSQPPNRRQISIVMQNFGGQLVFEVANLYDEQVVFDEKNYPHTSREGHGFGMASLKIFAEKYNAYTNFSQENGLFKVTMRWSN